MKLERRGGQAIPNDGFEAALAEGAARLFVSKNVLEADDFLGQRGDPCLRRIDHRQPLVQLGQMVASGFSRGFKASADPYSNRVEAVGDEPREIDLARSQNIGDAAQRSVQSGVLPRDLFHGAKHFTLPLEARKRLPAVHSGAAAEAPSHIHKQQQGERRRAEEEIGNRDGCTVKGKYNTLHTAISN